jgi:hypothetical protein
MTKKFIVEGLEFMKQHHYEWGLRKTTPNKIGVKKYYRSDEEKAISQYQL